MLKSFSPPLLLLFLLVGCTDITQTTDTVEPTSRPDAQIVSTSVSSIVDFESVDIAHEFINSVLNIPELNETIHDFAKQRDFEYNLNEARVMSYAGIEQQTVVIPSTEIENSTDKYFLTLSVSRKLERNKPFTLSGGSFVKYSSKHSGVYDINYYGLDGNLIAETIYDSATDISRITNSYAGQKGWWSDFLGCGASILDSFTDGGLGTATGIACLFESAFCGGAIVVVCGAGATYVNWCSTCGEVCYSCTPRP